MKCGRDGELVPSGECANPLEDGRGCPLIHCEVPITRGPPIIIDPPGRKKEYIFFVLIIMIHNIKVLHFTIALFNLYLSL